MDNTINIIFLSDEKYLLPTVVAMRTLTRQADCLRKYHIYLLLDKNAKEKWDTNYSFALPDNIKITIVIPEIQFPTNIDEHVYVSKMALTKFWFAEILSDVDKALYIDSDVLVTGDLQRLFDVDLESNYVAAVKDMPIYDDDYRQKIGLKEYFNSGMMLLNLELMRREELSEKLLDIKLHLSNSRYMDQDSFNIAFKDNVKFVSVLYNYIPKDLDDHSWEEFTEFYDITREDLKNVEIVHLSGMIKPWNTVHAYDYENWFSALGSNRELAECVKNYYNTIWGHIDDLVQALDKNIQRIDNQRAADTDEIRADIRYLKDHTAALAKENQHIDAHYKAQIDRIENQLTQQVQDLNLQLENIKKELAEQNQRMYDMEMLFWNRVGRKIKNIFRKWRS